MYFTPATIRAILRQAAFAPRAIRTDITVISMQQLAALGVPSAGARAMRAWVNRHVPGVKTWLRRAAGRVLPGGSMKVYAQPSAASWL